MHPRIADVTPRARPGRAIEVPKGVGVTPLIPWPQAALAPPFSFQAIEPEFLESKFVESKFLEPKFLKPSSKPWYASS